MDTAGTPLLPFDILMPNDVVIVPAFGTTLEIESTLKARGVTLTAYNTTCPFVEKVWRRSEEIGNRDYTVVIHGKRYHEETRATFSHAQASAPVVVVRDLEEARDLAKVIAGEADPEFFFEKFADRFSPGFDPAVHLKRIGVVNQTTMLATETEAIANLLQDTISTVVRRSRDVFTFCRYERHALLCDERKPRCNACADCRWWRYCCCCRWL